MKANVLKEVITPKKIQVQVGDKQVIIGQFRFGEIPLVLELVEKFYSLIEKVAKDKKSTDAQIFMKAANIVQTDFETVSQLLSMCSDIPVEDLKKMDIEPVIDLGRAIYEANKDFLLRKVKELQAMRQEAEAAQ